jgi:hypothetical protein
MGCRLLLSNTTLGKRSISSLDTKDILHLFSHSHVLCRMAHLRSSCTLTTSTQCALHPHINNPLQIPSTYNVGWQISKAGQQLRMSTQSVLHKHLTPLQQTLLTHVCVSYIRLEALQV